MHEQLNIWLVADIVLVNSLFLTLKRAQQIVFSHFLKFFPFSFLFHHLLYFLLQLCFTHLRQQFVILRFLKLNSQLFDLLNQLFRFVSMVLNLREVTSSVSSNFFSQRSTYVLSWLFWLRVSLSSLFKEIISSSRSWRLTSRVGSTSAMTSYLLLRVLDLTSFLF